MSISGNVNHLGLKVKQLGIDLQLPSDIYRLNQITVRNIFKSSKNQSMREIFEIAGMKIIQNESIVKRSHMQRLPNQLLKKNSEQNNDINE